MLLMIDNYDSFTYNLVQYFAELGAEVVVKRNDEITLAQIEQLKPERIVLSPGPCTPNEAGICLELLHQFIGRLPILGVCLGHQAIGQALGGKVIRAKQVMHGKVSEVYHHNTDVFANLPSPFIATRYHSLVIEQSSCPADLQITAWTQNAEGNLDEIMGVAHKSLPLYGVQFHPESILTQHGHALLANFLRL